MVAPYALYDRNDKFVVTKRTLKAGADCNVTEISSMVEDF